jgi:hypothetical protein
MGMQCHWWLASSLFLTNVNGRAYHVFKQLEKLETLLKKGN